MFEFTSLKLTATKNTAISALAEIAQTAFQFRNKSADCFLRLSITLDYGIKITCVAYPHDASTYTECEVAISYDGICINIDDLIATTWMNLIRIFAKSEDTNAIIFALTHGADNLSPERAHELMDEMIEATLG